MVVRLGAGFAERINRWFSGTLASVYFLREAFFIGHLSDENGGTGKTEIRMPILFIGPSCSLDHIDILFLLGFCE